MGVAVRLRSRGVVAEGVEEHLLTYNLEQVMPEVHDFKVILDYAVCSRRPWATGDPVSKSKESMEKSIGDEERHEKTGRQQRKVGHSVSSNASFGAWVERQSQNAP